MLVHHNDISTVLDELGQHNVLSIDTETTGLDRTDQPFAVIIGTPDTEYYFDARCSGDFWHRLNSLGPKEWALQNAKYDMKMLGRKGVSLLGSKYDCAVGARLLRNDHMRYSLDAQAQRYLGVPKSTAVKDYIKEHNLYEVRKDFFGKESKQPRYDWVPLEVMHNYACLDARLTYDLHKKYKAELCDKRTMLYAMEAKLTPVCLRMEEHGLLLDKGYTLAAMYAETQLAGTEKGKYLGMHGADFVNSAKAIQKHVTVELPKTEKGNPSLDDDVLDTILTSTNEKDVLTANTIKLIRTYDKRVSTYYKPYLNFADREGIVHPTMWQAGTRTGRFSYSDPNLQNMPKEEHSTAEHVVRGCFKPRAGRTFVSLDYSQMEYRMAAAYANETGVIASVMAGADFHQATADLVNITRSQAKTLNFAILYGAGADKIASMLGCSLVEANQLKFKYFSKLPKIEAFIDSVIRTGRARGYVESWCGRRMYADKEFCYALPNHLIQGGGADVVKLAMLAVADEFPLIPMVLQVHDQLVFEMAEEELRHVPRIKEIMESIFPPKNGMVLRVDVSISNGSLAERDMVKQ